MGEPGLGRAIASRRHPAGRELDAYARVVNAVEGNTTFYATPDAATIDRWRAATPPGFRFIFKLPENHARPAPAQQHAELRRSSTASNPSETVSVR